MHSPDKWRDRTNAPGQIGHAAESARLGRPGQPPDSRRETISGIGRATVAPADNVVSSASLRVRSLQVLFCRCSAPARIVGQLRATRCLFGPGQVLPISAKAERTRTRPSLHPCGICRGAAREPLAKRWPSGTAGCSGPDLGQPGIHLGAEFAVVSKGLAGFGWFWLVLRLMRQGRIHNVQSANREREMP